MAAIKASEDETQVTQVLTAKSLMGDDVVNTAGEHIGVIKDLMIDIN